MVLLKTHTFYLKIMCLLALPAGAAGGGNRKWTAYSLSEMHFHVLMENQFFPIAHVRIRIPINYGNRNITYA